MDFDKYKLLYRDACIWKLEQSKEGREYLQNAYILEHMLEEKKPDRKKLRQINTP